MNSQRGQALVECAVALVLLATVLAAIPCLTAYHDVQRAALRAARDASYMTGWAGMADSGLQIRRATAILRDAPWAHPADGRLLVSALDENGVQLADSAPPGRAAGLMDFIARPLGESQGLLSAALDLNRTGYRSTQVAVDVPAIRGAPAPFSQLTLRLAERASVLTESWNSGTPDHVAARVKPLVPSARLQSLIEPMHVLAAPLQFIEPAFAQLCIGRIEPDRVPETRLGPRVGRSRVVDPSSRSCT